MKTRKILLTILALSTFLTAVSSNSAKTADPVIRTEAKCGILPLQQAYATAKAVFVGKVSSVTQNDKGKTFEFQVEKYWKGSGSKNIRVKVYESMRYQAFYQVGKKYLVFAAEEDGGGLRDGRCSRSKDIADAAADLKALGKAKIPR